MLDSIASVQDYLKQHEHKDMLRFLTAGSVDDGKSTLIGRLLYDAKMIYEDQLAGVMRDSSIHGTTGDDCDPALLTDGLKAEREQGITIDVAYRYFSTDKRNFIICDAPGHEQYTRNMATGASHCNLAIILVDARHGVVAQTKRHSFIASLLGIRHFVVAVNKMDLVDYDEAAFRQIRRDYHAFASKLNVGDVHFLPISALKGDNVVDRSENMPWYQGEPLLSYLETVEVAIDPNLIDLRFPVQYVLRPDLDFRGFAGTLASGVVRPGDEVMAVPSGQRTRVAAISTYDGELDEAFAPMAVTLTMEDEIDISRGDMITHLHNVPTQDNVLEAQLVWMDDTPLTPGSNYLLKCGTCTVPATVTELRYAFDVNTLHRQDVDAFELNHIGRVVVRLHRTLCFDSYERNPKTGAFILIDRMTNQTAGAGMILDRQPNESLPRTRRATSAAADSLQQSTSLVSADERADRLGQQPFTLWLTGFPGAGKSTLAYALERRLFDAGRLAHVLDGQNLRLGISSDLGFAGEDRSENIRRAAEVARLCNDAGLITIAAFVSPYAADRESARTTIGSDRCLLVHVDAPLDVCEARGNQELFERARRGEVKNFSGITAPYEPPVDADIHLPTAEIDADTAVDQVLQTLRERGLIS